MNNYNFTDVKVLSGHNYYRLKRVDIDGNFTYSSTIRLDFSQFSWAISGNPIAANSWVQLQLAGKSDVIVQVYTIDGKLLQSINKGSLFAGTYSINKKTKSLLIPIAFVVYSAKIPCDK